MHLQIGDTRIDFLIASRFGLDGGAMFGIVPRALWSKKIPPDEENRIPMVTRVLLVSKGARKILVDVGFGSKYSSKERAIYALEDENLVGQLGAMGTSPEDVTDLVITHLHFDHAGGISRLDESGRTVPTFPNARHHVQRLNWEWALSPSPKDRGSYLARDFHPIAGEVDWNLLEGGAELAPGLFLLPCRGHTLGMQLLRIDAGSETFVFSADLFPTRWHLKPTWNMAYDNDPLVTVEEKRWFLTLALREGWTLLLEHDAQLAAVRPTDDRGGFEPLGWALQDVR